MERSIWPHSVFQRQKHAIKVEQQDASQFERVFKHRHGHNFNCDHVLSARTDLVDTTDPASQTFSAPTVRTTIYRVVSEAKPLNGSDRSLAQCSLSNRHDVLPGER